MRGLSMLFLPVLTATSAVGFAPVRTRNAQLPHRGIPNRILSFRGGSSISDAELAKEAYDWCSNLGAPAALVAGAVLVTLVESRETMKPSKTDEPWLQLSKKLCRMLLLTSFGLEIISIFVTTVTGTMLLSHGDRAAGVLAGASYHSAMGFLRHNLEFEYLTSRITFLQGLFNWLVGLALEIAVSRKGEGEATRRMNFFIASALTSIILLMISFYNHHVTFYNSYTHMLMRYGAVTFHRYFGSWPPRPMAFLYIPSIIATGVFGFRALVAPPDDDVSK